LEIERIGPASAVDEIFAVVLEDWASAGIAKKLKMMSAAERDFIGWLRVEQDTELTLFVLFSR
jgi:hypothetical protein